MQVRGQRSLRVMRSAIDGETTGRSVTSDDSKA
jgi:hypothetical protein